MKICSILCNFFFKLVNNQAHFKKILTGEFFTPSKPKRIQLHLVFQLETLQEQQALRQQEAMLNKQTEELLLSKLPKAGVTKPGSDAGSIGTPRDRKENPEEKKLRVSFFYIRYLCLPRALSHLFLHYVTRFSRHWPMTRNYKLTSGSALIWYGCGM